MVNKKISELDPAAPITGTEVVPLLQAGTTVAATVQQLLALIVAGAPGNLDTFFETATQLGLDETTVTTLQTLVAGKTSPSDVDAKIAAQAVADSATFSPLRATPAPTSLLRVAAPTTVSTLCGDDFTGTAGTDLNGRSTDQGASAAWNTAAGTWQLDGAGHVSPTTTGDGLLAVLTPPPAVSPGAYTISVDALIALGSGTGNRCGLIFWYLDQQNYWYFQTPYGGGTAWTVFKVAAGTSTMVFQAGIPKDTGTTSTIRVDLWGKEAAFWIDGIQIYTLTNPTAPAGAAVGIRQGMDGYDTACVFSNFRITNHQGPRFNIPRLDTAPSQQVLPHGPAGSWESADANNPNVVWDPVNSRWVLYYSGFDDASTSTIQGMGLAYSPTLDGTFVKDPDNPVMPATTGNVENGGLIWTAGRWLKVEDGGGWYTSPDLHTWTPLTVYGIPAVGDPFLRETDTGLLEVYYGINIPATAIGLAVSADGGTTWEIQDPVVALPDWLGARGHGEPSVYVPHGKEGVEAMVLCDLIVDSSGRGATAAAVTVDGGDTWYWSEIARGSGTGFDSFQVFDSCPVFDNGTFYLFHSASPVEGGEVRLDCTIGRRAVQYTSAPIANGKPVPYQ